MIQPASQHIASRQPGRAVGATQRTSVRGFPWPANIAIVRPEETGRRELERYIHGKYRKTYGADIQQFMPSLVALRHPSDGLMGALGYRAAGEQRLFLEAYVDVPVEMLLSQRLRISCRRSDIVEVGNLAATTPGGARWLIALCAAFFKGMGFRWVVLTVTPALHNSFSRLGIDLIPLTKASKQRIRDAEKHWGSYYDVKPHVVAGDIRLGFHVLRGRLFMQEGSFAAKALWCRAYRLGALYGRAGLSMAALFREVS